MIRPGDIVIRTRRPLPQPVEVVERKGLGHPDTLCDAIAERICVHLCREYLRCFDTILHHNVDKVLLCGGESRPCFGGGEVLRPMEIYLAGRATQEWRGRKIPVHEVAIEACREVLQQHVPDIDVARHVRIHSCIRSGSSDLTALFGRGGAVPLANDTSCGVGFAPLTDLERVVLEIERRANSAGSRRDHPYAGGDMKVMGVRRGDEIQLTISRAFIGRHVADLEDYLRKKQALAALALETARELTDLHVECTLNTADAPASGDVFLTVIGTSAEAGDDGEVGRGNRSNGLITPYRPMTMEASAGKNPVSHVGKLYNVIAGRIADRITSVVPGVSGATCLLVSRIGAPIDEPQLADLELHLDEKLGREDVRAGVGRILTEQLALLPALRGDLLEQRISLY